MKLHLSLTAALTLSFAAPALGQALLNDSDRHPILTLSADRLGVIYTQYGITAGVRSTVAIQPRSGFYYFEGHREMGLGDYGFGVATAAHSLSAAGGSDRLSVGVSVTGRVFFNGLNQQTWGGQFDTYGLAIDYRGDSPIVHVISQNTIGGPGVYIGRFRITDIRDPLYVYVYGTRQQQPLIPQQTVNLGNDLGARPFRFDPVAVLNATYYRGGDGLILGWASTPAANAAPVVSLQSAPATLLLGAAVSLQASAADAESGNLTTSIQWSDSAGPATGTGGSFSFTPATVGLHTVTARATDPRGAAGTASVLITVIDDPRLDSDGDGLSYAEELAFGTDPSASDSDHDLLADGDEVDLYGTDPANADSDLDGAPDGWELSYNFDPTIANAAADSDGDGASNLAEYQAGTDPSYAASFPGRGTVRLSSSDRDPAVQLSADGLGVTITAAGQHAVRSVTAVQPGSGWYYYEGRREGATGSFGFGVASATAPLNNFGGATDQSVGINALGQIFYNGAQLATFPDPLATQHYGVAVDYRGANPLVYFMVNCTPVPTYGIPDNGGLDGRTCVDPTPVPPSRGASGLPVRLFGPYPLSNVTGPVYMLVYGDQLGAGIQQTVNAGADALGAPFHFPAGYILFNEGIAGAELMGSGWGPEHTYAGRPVMPQFSRVELLRRPETSWGLVLAPNNLGAAYTIFQKSSVLANQGMIGEFRYFETHREVAPINIGSGVNTAYAQSDPYCFLPQQPSMSVNSLGGVWRNLVFQVNYPNTESYYGFAVDYRGPRPRVYTIIGNAVVSTLDLDVYTPLYPMLYGNPITAPVLANSINFGATPFHYNPRAILTAAGVSTTQFVEGWGAANVPNPPSNRAPRVLMSSSADMVLPGTAVTVFATAVDAEDGDLTASIQWSDSLSSLVATGPTFTLAPTQLGAHVLTARVTDRHGAQGSATVVITVVSAAQLDSDGDGLSDQDEALNGTSPALADSDGDGLSDGDEVHTWLTNPLSIDSDGDGMGDGFEATHGLSPRVFDAQGDADLDGYTNLQEYQAGTDPGSLRSYPGVALLNPNDRHPSVALSPDRLGVTYTESLERGVRSDVAIGPGSGLYYFEGRRLVDRGNFGFGVATRSASLDGIGGADGESLGVSALGAVWYGGNPVAAFTGTQDTYGLLVDYRGAFPIVHLLTSASLAGPGSVVATVEMSQVHQPLHVLVYGRRFTAQVQQRVNTGNDLSAAPFRFDPLAALTAAGVPNPGALVLGWGPRAAPRQAVVLNELDRYATVSLSADRLGVSFGESAERGVRSNIALQPGSGFYYYEGRREVPVGNYGFGVATAQASLATGGGATNQSLGVNRTIGVIYNGQWIGSVAGAQTTYGFAVDYRSSTPVVHILASAVVGGPAQLVRSVAMPAVSTPLYIYLYGTRVSSGVQQTINAGDDLQARPFAYDPVTALRNAGVSGSEALVLGWQPPPPAQNRPPSVGITTAPAVIPVGYALDIRATASDPEDGDLTASITWSVDQTAATGTGNRFDFTAPAVGSYVITARVEDSSSAAAVATLNVTVVTAVDSDGDGLLDPQEAIYGTNPALADTDGDTLSDGQEVNVLLTNPLSGDTDGDSMPDGYEVGAMLDPRSNDAAADSDGDGWSNLDEYLAGTDPNQSGSFPGSHQRTLLNPDDRSPALSLTGDQLGAIFAYGGPYGVRSTVAVQPGSGVFYYEGHREVAAGNYGFGVASASATLAAIGGSSNQSVGINALGGIYANGGYVGRALGSFDTFGFVVDYRETSPRVHIITSSTLGGPGMVVRTQQLTAVTGPVYIFVYGTGTTTGLQQTINAGDDLATRPLRFDPAQALYDAAIDGAAVLNLGWSAQSPAANSRPTLTLLSPPSQAVLSSAPVTLQATAADAEDGDLTALISWTVRDAPQTGSGQSFSWSSPVLGEHVIVATVRDSRGQSASVEARVTVSSAPDSDGDGLTDPAEANLGTDPQRVDTDNDTLSDGAEVLTYGTNPLSGDTDADTMADADEISAGLDPRVNDALADPDGDGFGNAAELLGHTNPHDGTSYPGAPRITLLSDTDRSPAITLTTDRLGAIFAWGGPYAVRSNQRIEPGSGLYYYEGHREVATGNFGFGLATAQAPLNSFGGGNAFSMGVNAFGGIWLSGSFVGRAAGTQDTWGFALDYRGATPVVYVIGASATGSGALLGTVTMSAVSGPLYIYVYGDGTTTGVQQTINTGGDLINRPFRFDPVPVLTAAGVANAGSTVLGWR